MEHALNNFRQSLRDSAAKFGLPAFGRWWMGELAPLLPSRPKTALARRRARPVLVFDAGEAILWEPRVDNGSLSLVEAARIPLAADAQNAGRAAIDALSRRVAGGSAVKVLIALTRAQVLRKQFTLPAAIEENLLDALAFDLDRHTPFRADQLYFDAVVVGRDVPNRLIRVDWAAALKGTVDAARRHAETWGAVVVGVMPDAPDANAGSIVPLARWSKLNLLPEEERPETLVWRRPQVIVPAVLVALALIAAIVLPIWQKRDYVVALTEVTDQARTQAAASDALRQQLDQATGDYNFVLGRKYAFPSTIKLLDDVTRLLPDDTWLTQFEIKTTPKGKEPHREIMLRGESGNAGRLVSALEDSKLFEQAAPRSPTTKIQPGPGEVFDLGALLKPLPPPEFVQLAVAPRVTPAPAQATSTPPPATAGSAPAATVGTAAAPAGAAPVAAAQNASAPAAVANTGAAPAAGAPTPRGPLAGAVAPSQAPVAGVPAPGGGGQVLRPGSVVSTNGPLAGALRGGVAPGATVPRMHLGAPGQPGFVPGAQPAPPPVAQPAPAAGAQPVPAAGAQSVPAPAAQPAVAPAEQPAVAPAPAPETDASSNGQPAPAAPTEATQ